MKTTWPFILFLNVSVGVQLEECNYTFFTRLEKGTVYFLGVVTNLTLRERGGDCSLSGDTTSDNSRGSDRPGEV